MQVSREWPAKLREGRGARRLALPMHRNGSLDLRRHRSFIKAECIAESLPGTETTSSRARRSASRIYQYIFLIS
jgi:hypothetical protein